MKRREKILAMLAGCVLIGYLGLPQLHAIFIAPIEEKQVELDAANEQLAATMRSLSNVQRASRVLEQWRQRSLPPRPQDAQRHYQDWLTDLAQMVDFDELKVMPGRTTPQGNAYTGVHVLLEGKARMSNVGEFLYRFYRIDLPHRIVLMNIDCPAAEGDPVLDVAMTAEGLAIHGAAEREFLFPTAQLNDGFKSSASAQDIQVDKDRDFPQDLPLRVRVGNEYLKVLARDGSRWTVEGSRDATSPGNHAAGDAIELAPVWPGYADLTLDDFRQRVGKSPFIKPPPPAGPTRVAQPRVNVRRDDPAKDTVLSASILVGEKPIAWLYRKSNADRTVIHEQSELNIGDVQAVVLEIQRDHVVLRHENASWRLDMGDPLSTMQKIENEKPSETLSDRPDAANEIADETVEVSTPPAESSDPTLDEG